MKFGEIQAEAQEEWEAFNCFDQPRVLIGAASCGRAVGAVDVLEACRSELEACSVNATIATVGCLGLCFAEVLVEVACPGGPRILYGNTTPESIRQIIRGYIIEGDPCGHLALATLGEKGVEGIPHSSELPFLRDQVRIVMKNCGAVDPENINHYVANGGYSGLVYALQMSPDEVIEEVTKSGLRGRGGVGFPTGRKWLFVRSEEVRNKYVVANAEEGEAGTFKDRMLMESDPHALIEGMLIAAYAIGARKGWIFVQAHYPLAAERLSTAISQVHQYGLCGQNILGSDFSFDIEVRSGIGSYICGEETALLECIEGKRGIPRIRPPFPAQKGFNNKPTLVNNIETFANVPVIIREGAAQYRCRGTQRSPGTKLFSLSGNINHPGTFELPLGVKLRSIVFDIGGGLSGGRPFQAAIIGGPTGGYVPEVYLDHPLDFDSFGEIGAMMGSGAVVIVDDTVCVLNTVYHQLSFLADESCGKCMPCRLGTSQLSELLRSIVEGEGDGKKIALLKEIAHSMKYSALCGLGQAAPNPILTSLLHFRKEYDAHINHKQCSAGMSASSSK